VSTAAALGEVSLAKGWTATMLEMPKKIVTVEGGRKVNYYTAHAAERLKKQEESELRFFGGPDAHEVMRKLHDSGLAGTGALAAKLTREYFEYSRGDWLKRGARSIRILAEECAVHAEIAEISSLSAHADRDELLRWCRSCSGTPRKVAVVHGEPESAKAFSETLTRELGWDVVIPSYLETIAIGEPS
jgi:Cft2 family RNA processing exonuclease